MEKRLSMIPVVLFLSALAAGSAHAQFANISGTLTPGGPTMPVVFISSPSCTGQGATAVLYEAHPLTVDTAGVYTFTLTSTGNFASVYLYITSFNPTNGLMNCIAASNSGNPRTFNFGLDQFNSYQVVVFDDQVAQNGGDYQLTIDAPPTTTTTTTSTTTTTTTTLGCGAVATFSSVTCRLSELRGEVEAGVPDARLAGKLSGTLTKARLLVVLAEELAGNAKKARRTLAKVTRALVRFDKLIASGAGQQIPTALRDEFSASSGAIKADVPNLLGA